MGNLRGVNEQYTPSNAEIKRWCLVINTGNIQLVVAQPNHRT